MHTLYGIKQCGTVKKAQLWLQDHQIAYEFYDVKVAGLTQAQLAIFAEALGWEALVNKRSTTWRQIPEPRKQDLTQATALQLLIDYPTLMKRPILAFEGGFLLGFNAEHYQNTL